MDQTTPDRATPERTAEPTANPAAAASGSDAARPARVRRIEARLRAKVGADAALVAWTRAWVSRATRLHRLLAARTLDFAVLTDSSLMIVSIGFFTRRPRRCVYSSELQAIVVNDDPVPKGRRLRINSPSGPALWIELRGDVQAVAFADALVARAQREPS
jgi:hypothetical protein